MQQHESRQYVGVDGRILQDRGVDECRTGISEKERRVGFVEIVAAAAGHPDQNEIANQQKQESGVDFQASPQRARNDRRPALLPQRAAIGQHAGVAGHEHKHFGGVAEAVVARRQPGERIIGDVIDEDEPQRQPAARIQPQVTAISVDVTTGTLQPPANDRSRPQQASSNSPLATSCYRFGSDCLGDRHFLYRNQPARPGLLQATVFSEERHEAALRSGDRFAAQKTRQIRHPAPVSIRSKRKRPLTRLSRPRRRGVARGQELAFECLRRHRPAEEIALPLFASHARPGDRRSRGSRYLLRSPTGRAARSDRWSNRRSPHRRNRRAVRARTTLSILSPSSGNFLR